MSKFLDLIGTTLQSFRLGIGGVLLQNSSGKLLLRTPNNSGDAEIQTAKVNNTGDTIVIGTGNTLTLSRNSGTAAATTIIFPAGKGTDGQVLRQKAGTAANVIELEYVSIGGSTDKVTTDTTTLAFGSTSPLALFTLPANAVVQAVRVIIDTAFNGTPSLSIGVTGTTSKYLASNQVDLTQATCFELYPSIPANSSAENLIATYAAGGATAGSARIEIDYVIPT